MKLHLLHPHVCKTSPWGHYYPAHYQTFCGRRLYARYTVEYRTSLDSIFRDDTKTAPIEFLTDPYYSKAATKDIVKRMPPARPLYQHFWEIGWDWRVVLVATQEGSRLHEDLCKRCLKTMKPVYHIDGTGYTCSASVYWPGDYDDPLDTVRGVIKV